MVSIACCVAATTMCLILCINCKENMEKTGNKIWFWPVGFGVVFSVEPGNKKTSVCARVCRAHVCLHYRVCRPDDAGHNEPSGEEETGLHPWAHPDWGDLRGGPGAGVGGKNSGLYSLLKASQLKMATTAKENTRITTTLSVLQTVSSFFFYNRAPPK